MDGIKCYNKINEREIRKIRKNRLDSMEKSYENIMEE